LQFFCKFLKIFLFPKSEIDVVLAFLLVETKIQKIESPAGEFEEKYIFYDFPDFLSSPPIFYFLRENRTFSKTSHRRSRHDKI